MSYLADIAQYEHLHWEHRQSVTVTLKRSSTETERDTEYALRLDANKARQIFGGAALTVDEAGWIIPAAELDDDETIEPGDTIEEADQTMWTVQDAQRVRFNSQWACRAVKQVE